jgi:adenosylcobyric acid synthase
VLPGTKATVEDLRKLREEGLDEALKRRKGPILGICGGYQMLGHRIQDGVESADNATGLGLLDLNTTFQPEKLLRRVSGTVLGVPATGYEIRHGRVDRDEPLIQDGDVLGTAWHGLLEGDAVRRKLLSWVATRTGRDWTPGTRAFADVREAHLDRLADWFGADVDPAALIDLIQQGAPEGLPTIPPGGTACSVF